MVYGGGPNSSPRMVILTAVVRVAYLVVPDDATRFDAGLDSVVPNHTLAVEEAALAVGQDRSRMGVTIARVNLRCTAYAWRRALCTYITVRMERVGPFDRMRMGSAELVADSVAVRGGDRSPCRPVRHRRASRYARSARVQLHSRSPVSPPEHRSGAAPVG